MLVEDAIQLYKEGNRVLLLTYTVLNRQELEYRVISQFGFLPSRIRIQTWLSFLLNECARPYQNVHYNNRRIRGITFVQGQSAQYIKETQIYGHFIEGKHSVYSDKLAKFALKCNADSGGMVVNRLQQFWDYILIDEAQDLASYDLDIVAMLFKSNMKLIVVGDVRQVVYSTHHAKRLSKFRKEKAIDFYRAAAEVGLCQVEERTECYRSVQSICAFADRLYPDLPETVSMYEGQTEHQGLFVVPMRKVVDYYEEYKPVVLCHSRRSNTKGIPSINFGKSKGQTYLRTLVFPTKPITNYLKTGDIAQLNDRHKFYVALTRARESVAFATNVNSDFVNEYFESV